MNCIFCLKEVDGENKSKEHIIPESLGNIETILPPGIVCDKCNNYFSRKIEQPILNSPMIRLLRFDRNIPNKKGNIPPISQGDMFSLPDYRLMGRLLGKIGVEMIALRCQGVNNWNYEMKNQKELIPVRNFVRFNIGDTWPFFYRTIYPVNAIFSENGTFFEVLNECDLLYTKTKELYVVVALFGVEFTMNLGGPFFEGYINWLKKNNYNSPLYIGKNQ